MSRSSYELNNHIINVHQKMQRPGYKCKHCEEFFTGESDIRQHLTTSHQIVSEFTMHFVNTFFENGYKEEEEEEESDDYEEVQPVKRKRGPPRDRSVAVSNRMPMAPPAEPTIDSRCSHCGEYFESTDVLFQHLNTEANLGSDCPM